MVTTASHKCRTELEIFPGFLRLFFVNFLFGCMWQAKQHSTINILNAYQNFTVALFNSFWC